MGPFGDFRVRAAWDTGLLLEQPGQSKWAPLQRAVVNLFVGWSEGQTTWMAEAAYLQPFYGAALNTTLLQFEAGEGITVCTAIHMPVTSNLKTLSQCWDDIGAY